jgi:hypothetical protein
VVFAGTSTNWSWRPSPRVDRSWCVHALEEKFHSIDWKQARDDVRAFVRPADLASLDVWCQEFFLAQLAKLPASPN